jgi:hypothetical protein
MAAIIRGDDQAPIQLAIVSGAARLYSESSRPLGDHTRDGAWVVRLSSRAEVPERS